MTVMGLLLLFLAAWIAGVTFTLLSAWRACRRCNRWSARDRARVHADLGIDR